ncbi:MAG: M14 family zinc carboxypeptidase [Gemmatimonadota bacterium]|nr:M14 family zinc carboxypeptidase [Gemmatimonadota bacterium]
MRHLSPTPAGATVMARWAARALIAAALAAIALAPQSTVAQADHSQGAPIPSPEEFFGHQMGADRKLARWDRLVEYYELIDAASDRVQVVHMGPSTLGEPFLSIFVSAPENLARLDDFKRMNAVLQDPRGHSRAAIDDAIANGKVVFVQSYALHSTEVAGAQSPAEIMYMFATRDDAEVHEILDNTISILIPAFNPDGVGIVNEWYDRWVGTEYEGASPPELYHHYIGHDNNRDAFMQNTVESRYGAEIMFREWIPQAYIDHHQMGAYTARIYLPPYAEPIRPEGDPLVWREMSWYGAHMAYRMEEAGFEGTVNAAIYSGWGHFGFHWITPFHNIAGMLTESASARLATPLYVHPDQLQGSRQLPEYEAQTTFPNPWPGGWWRVRDIVERQIVATFSPLEIAAKNRETVLRNAYNKSSRQIQRGMGGDVKAYVIPAAQHDPLTMATMVNKLLLQGITVERAPADFTHEGRVYGEGSYVVSLAQPKRGVIRWLLGQTYYPDNSYTRTASGDPIRPYDMSADVIAEFMGVRVDPVGTAVEADLTVVSGPVEPAGMVASSAPHGYRIDGTLNDAFKALNMLFAAGASVRRVTGSGAGAMPGDFIVEPGAAPDALADIAAATGVDFTALAGDATAVSHPLTQQRIGMYQRFYGGNMDEGWTRWLLEDFGFEYTSLFDPEILAGDLHERWDVIILPNDSRTMMLGPTERAEGGRGPDPTGTPPDYRSGFGEAGVAALDAFVRSGGTLVTFAQAGELVLEGFDVPVRNAVAGMWGNQFWAPGSTLKVKVDTSSPYGYGMPEDALAAYLAGGQVYETMPGARSSDVRRVVTYIDRDILQSGWLLGEEAIANKAAMVSVAHGEGTIVMIGFRAQHRAQTHGTFKLVFNALVGG